MIRFGRIEIGVLWVECDIYSPKGLLIGHLRKIQPLGRISFTLDSERFYKLTLKDLRLIKLQYKQINKYQPMKLEKAKRIYGK